MQTSTRLAAVGLSILVVCWSHAPLRAQQPRAECNQTPPEHKVDRNGNVLPEYREWDWNQCPPVVQHSASAASVSVQSLRHKPANPARKEFDRGVQAWRRGQTEEAERHLAQAVELDSVFPEARVELGALYAESGQPARALEYFSSALVLDPRSAGAYAGKAAVLVILSRAGEAEQAARQALELDPGLIAAHFTLGTALLMQEKLTPEAASHLKIAASRFPRARAVLESLQKTFGSSQMH
jgi:tetratricopeptide (TPR) repeat protein